MDAKWNGDYTVKGRDYDTELVGEITDEVIDADRLCRLEYSNGFPNFAIYRLVLAGDRSYMPIVRPWWELFALEWCRSNMRGGFSPELAVIASWDSLHRVCHPNESHMPAQDAADALDVDLETYTRARNSLKAVLGASLAHYWGLLGAMYRIVNAVNKKV